MPSVTKGGELVVNIIGMNKDLNYIIKLRLDRKVLLLVSIALSTLMISFARKWASKLVESSGFDSIEDIVTMQRSDPNIGPSIYNTADPNC